MHMKNTLLLTLSSVIILAGCTAPKPEAMDHSDHDASMTMEDMVQMLDGKTGDEFDKAFIEGMIPHHQGAIDMAVEALQNAKHQEIKDMAEAIISTQQSEIDLMRQWQEEWGYTE